MASIAFASRTEVHGLSIHRALRGLLTLPRSVLNWHKARQARNALHRLSDKQLDDIGIARGEIGALTFGSLKRY